MLVKPFLALSIGVILLLSLSACGLVGDEQAPVVEGYRHSTAFTERSKKKSSGDYRVKKGDTLYSIAWANNLDYRTLAEMNHLHRPYRIYAGQYLRTRRNFFESLSQVFKGGNSTPPKTQVTKREPVSQKSRLAKGSDQYEIIRPQKTTVSKKQHPVKPSGIQVHPTAKAKPLKGWRWPADGRVVQGYSAHAGGNKGIDIAGRYGASIHAAGSGKVVYSGSGLKGYGQLLLIKHNSNFLSAYAHNKRLLVSEGDEVKSGQKIAEMGRTNHGMIRLHFEIRQNGQPVDPMIYLAPVRKS